MIVLALDTAAELCAACLYDGVAGDECGRAVLDIGKGHAEHVIAVIDDALKAAGMTYADIGRIAVSVGPGSFTGVRVGVSAARGLALALKVPARGVSTLEALAHEAAAANPGRPVLVLLGNRPEALFAALYAKDGTERLAPVAAPVEELAARVDATTVLTGRGAAHMARHLGLSENAVFSDAATADIATYARLALMKGDTAEKPKPLYLREADAKPQAGFALPRRGGA